MWLNKLLHRVKHIVDSNAQLSSPQQSATEETTPPKESKPADMSFYVKKLNESLFEVSLKDFPSSKGRGTTPEQALGDLLQCLNGQIDNVVKQTLLMNMHKDEIKDKYKTLIEHFYTTLDNQKKGSWFQRLTKRIIAAPKPVQVLEVNISLKEADVTRSIMDRLIPKELPFANLSRLSMMPNMMMPNMMLRQDPLPNGPHIPELEHRFLLRSSQDITEPPLNLVFDSEGFDMEETFTFGIVVNLN